VVQCFKKNPRTSRLNWETPISKDPTVGWNVLERDIIFHGIKYICGESNDVNFDDVNKWKSKIGELIKD